MTVAQHLIGISLGFGPMRPDAKTPFPKQTKTLGVNKILYHTIDSPPRACANQEWFSMGPRGAMLGLLSCVKFAADAAGTRIAGKARRSVMS